MSASTKRMLKQIASGERQPSVTYAGSFRDLHFQIREIIAKEGGGPNWPFVGKEPQQPACCVYFVSFKMDDIRMVKIGYANDFAKRFKYLSKDFPPFDWTLRELGRLYFGGWFVNRIAESLFIEGLREYHHKGEWFKMPEQIEREIIQTCRMVNGRSAQ